MPKKINRKAMEWFLKSELPALREKCVVPEESLAALRQYYTEQSSQPGIRSPEKWFRCEPATDDQERECGGIFAESIRAAFRKSRRKING